MTHIPGDDPGVFLAVCEAGSFAAAASGIGLSPSAVAKAVARLEQRLGIALFHRTTRRLSLTGEGIIYRDHCHITRAEMARVETMLSASTRHPAGTVRVSLPPLLGTHIIAPALYELCRLWPLLSFDIALSTQKAELSAGDIDLAVRIGDLPDLPAVMARRLGLQRVALCCSPACLAERSPPENVEDLADHRLIATRRDHRPLPWLFREVDGTLRSITPHAALMLDGSLLTLSAIRAGHGIGLVPRWLVQDEIASGALISVLDDRLAGHLPVHVLWPAAPAMLPRLRVSIDTIVATAQKAVEDGLLI
ncbi:LysR family transcriptional regulator [Novosphingobium terrae]|uniref:LysR family transcriptional regulator n=1 Tax=Novosphingobium terrae TaxID=2726189 RepID=UPI001980E51E|nr:LysR family transcriptional regulator [Novosphingobium terrae]